MVRHPQVILYPLHPCQERADGRRVLCATVVLDKGAESLQQRVANKLYESSRAGSLEVANFPEYKHLLSALQHVQPSEPQTSYQVTVKRHDKLVILSALASKFLELDDFKEEATQLIEKHNQEFNPDGEYMAEPENPRTAVDEITIIVRTCTHLFTSHYPIGH